MLSVKRNDIIGNHGVGRSDRDSKVILRQVDAQTVRSVWPDALPHRHGHRSAHKRVGHTLIVYLSRRPEFMAMFREVDGALMWVREGHLSARVIYTSAN